jgi:ATP-dependent DNA ligase
MANQKKKRGHHRREAARRRSGRARVLTPTASQVMKRLPEGTDWIYELKFDGYAPCY